MIWNSTRCHRSPPPLLSCLSKGAESPPDHRIISDRLDCGPTPLRDPGQHSCSSFQDESLAHPQSVARLKKCSSSPSAALHPREWRNSQEKHKGKCTSSSLSTLLGIRKQQVRQKGWKGKRQKEQSYFSLIQSFFEGTVILNGPRGIFFYCWGTKREHFCLTPWHSKQVRHLKKI